MKNHFPSIPIAPKKVFFHKYHGVAYEDCYAWIRDKNWEEVMRNPSNLDPEIEKHLLAENSYATAVLSESEKLASEIFEEMKGRTKKDDVSVPKKDGNYLYFEKFLEEGQYPIFCRKLRGKEEVILDINDLAKGKEFFKFSQVQHSPNHKFLAYSFDESGSEIYTIRIREIGAGIDFDDQIENTGGFFEWSNDSKSLIYTRLDKKFRPYLVNRHVLNKSQSLDTIIFEEKDPGFFVSLGKTESRKYIIINSHDHQTSEIRLVSADASFEAPILISERVAGCEYEVAHRGDRLYLLTNSNGAEDFKIVSVSEDELGQKKWGVLVKHQEGVLIQELHIFQKFWVRLELFEGLPRIIVTEFQSGESHEITFDEPLYDISVEKGLDFDSQELRIVYSSLKKPRSVFDYDMANRELVLRKEQEIPSGHNPKDYKSERLLAPGRDGELIPISLLYRKDTPVNGTAPLLLYGYGSYGVPLSARFSVDRFSLVDRGFIFGIAHVRGGVEKGKRWYKKGRREQKKNTFSDFEDAALHLIEKRYTDKGLIVAHGGSAGGMLVGACLNMSPDLYGAIIAEVPFVDVLNTMCDSNLPLTPIEWPEWGNPLTDKQAFDYIKSYSPYDQVKKKNYPAIFVTAGLTDPRVGYWEPAKWVARLRELKIDNNIIILKTSMKAGHGGASGRFDRLKERAEAYSFVISTIVKKL